MLVIRHTQLERFREHARATFARSLLERAEHFSPIQAAALGRDAMARVVERSLLTGRRHGLTLRGPLRLVLELSLLFGADFDTDPRCPWAAEALSRDLSEVGRARELYEAACDHRWRVFGDADANALSALRGMANMPLVDDSGASPADICQAMRRTHADIALALGDTVLASIASRAVSVAQRAGLPMPQGAALLAVLMIEFGHGCLDDPLHPWLARTWHDQTIGDAFLRIQRLERKARLWARQTLALRLAGAVS